MTNKEIEKFNKKLTELSKKSVSGGPIKDFHKRYDDLKKIYFEVESLAAELGVLLVGANFMNLVINESDIEKRVVQEESYIAELFNNIRNALQTEMMLNACISAEDSCKLSKRSCFWAAVAAIAACISVILFLFLS